MIRSFHILLFVFITCHAAAQSHQSIRIKPGDDVRETLLKAVYQYPQFTFGKAHFSKGDVSGARINYNYASQTFEFINPQGDTLVLANENTIAYVSVGADTFYYSNGFLQKLASTNKVTLAVKRKLVFADVQKVGAMGLPTSTSTIESKALYTDKKYNLAINEELVFTKHATYFIRNGNDAFVPATKKNILKLYPKQQSAIEQYVTQHQVDFTKEADLLQLVSFLNTL